jgi:opacity protein-like surface antigen
MYAQGMKPSHFVSALSVLAALTSTLPAFAQAGSFGSKGKFVVSAERLTGFYITSGSTELNGTTGAFPAPFTIDTDDSSTTFALLGSGVESEPAAFPRLGADFFIIDKLSVGGSITYASRSDSTERVTATGNFAAETVDVDESRTVFAASPRAGFAMMFSDMFGVWARGGITYTSMTIETDETAGGARQSAELRASLLTLAVDGQLLITPFNNVAIGVGPQLDIPLTGDVDYTDYAPIVVNVEGDASVLTFGISAGMMLYF